MKEYIAKKHGKQAKDYANVELSEEEKDEANEALMRTEAEMPISDRKTAGDASESGLVKFVHTIMDINEARK